MRRSQVVFDNFKIIKGAHRGDLSCSSEDIIDLILVAILRISHD